MGYCNADCEYLTTRHNCKKYNKGLTYSKFSSRSISTGTVHERCSECDKDHWIAELEKRIKPMKTSGTGYDELYTEFFKCPVCGHENIISGSNYCPDCGQRVTTE